jgi:hypothetical protein
MAGYPNPFGDLANTLASGGQNPNDWMQRIQQFRQRFAQGGLPTGGGGQMPWGMPREPWGGTGTGQKPPIGQSPITGTQPPPQMGQGGQTPLGTQQPMMPWRVPMAPPPAQAPTGGQMTGTFANSPTQAPPVQLPGQVTQPAPPPTALGGQATGTFAAPSAQTQQQPTPIGNIFQPQQGTQTQPQQPQQPWAASLLRPQMTGTFTTK